MKKILIGLVLTFGLVSQSYAWGDREQGALVGLAAGVLLNQVYSTPRYYSQPQPVYIQPPVVYNGYITPPILRPTYTHQIYYDSLCNCNRQIVVQTGWSY